MDKPAPPLCAIVSKSTLLNSVRPYCSYWTLYYTTGHQFWLKTKNIVWLQWEVWLQFEYIKLLKSLLMVVYIQYTNIFEIIVSTSFAIIIHNMDPLSSVLPSAYYHPHPYYHPHIITESQVNSIAWMGVLDMVIGVIRVHAMMRHALLAIYITYN